MASLITTTLPLSFLSLHLRRHRFTAVFSSSSALPSTTHRTSQKNVIDILEQRGLIDALTSPTLRAACSPHAPPLKVYCGFDPTADSLHLGNLIGVVVLSWFHRCGHSPVALIGGATALIGDPSGKSSERPSLDDATLADNTLAISQLLGKIGRNNFLLVNNYDWWKQLTFLDFMKNVGRHARVGAMMSKDSVKKRLESEHGMSFMEFSYQLLQGYDFLHLWRHQGVCVQIGGSDQWGNITAGTDLIRRIFCVDDEVYGMTFPLLLKSDGTKFGKSEEGAVWLSPRLLSPYKFYQYFFGVADEDVVRFLRILTFLELEEIEEIERGMKEGAGYVPNSAQRRLAEELTRFVHGEEGLEEAVKATQALRPGAETRLDWGAIEGIAKDVPCYSLGYERVLGMAVVELSVLTGLLESKSAVRRMLKQGGLYLNNNRVDSEAKVIEVDDIVDGKVLLLSAGKKNKMVVRVS
ncbi:hypothetical protein vseg_019778 [Gypsophila vaccaria]